MTCWHVDMTCWYIYEHRQQPVYLFSNLQTLDVAVKLSVLWFRHSQYWLKVRERLWSFVTLTKPHTLSTQTWVCSLLVLRVTCVSDGVIVILQDPVRMCFTSCIQGKSTILAKYCQVPSPKRFQCYEWKELIQLHYHLKHCCERANQSHTSSRLHTFLSTDSSCYNSKHL